ncbi:V-type ATPase subunit [Blastococcus sp. KM273129]|uniref:V-type ATPase subunit n=1 Tax=Blastococcus sp. KM273129 TaxID=2570315 RepID=UPI001F165E79|nr:V-type ATPase subunit [Blastococcus sp. KM273129]MCF6735547.1 hypothetical protein [Blastococcus sp. KM273129]
MRRPDFVMGNTRLRARRAALLDREQVARLAGEDLTGLAAHLRATVYGPLLAPGPVSRQALLAAVEERRRHALRGVGDVYRGEAGQVVGALLARYDLADTLTLLRGAAHDLPDDEVLAALHGVGALTPAAARHVVAEEAEAVVHRLAAARLPDPETATAAQQAWDRYLLHDDLAELEAAVARVAMARSERLLSEAGLPVAPLRRFLAAERDAANLLAALRVSQNGSDPADMRAHLLPPGAIPTRTLVAVGGGSDPIAAAPPAWRSELTRAVNTGDLTGLGQGLERLLLAEAVLGFRTGDPLGVAIPLAYVAAVEEEALALRRLVTQAPAGEPAPPSVPSVGAGTGRSAPVPASAPPEGWPGDLLAIVPDETAAGFRLAGTRTVAERDPAVVRELVDAELTGGFGGVIAVAERTWAALPASVRTEWAASTVPLIIPLPVEDDTAAGSRRARMQELLARSVGYEITFTPEGDRT